MTPPPRESTTPLLEQRIGALSIQYDERVLRPRPWTAAQSEWAAVLGEEVPPGPLLELCSGAGHIGLLAARLTGRDAVLVDASAAACELATLNAARNGLEERVQIRQGDLASALGVDETFPLVLADPPYLRSADTSRYPEDPRSAVDGGRDGLEIARSCLRVAGAHLDVRGAVVLQLRDQEQAEELGDDAGPAGLRVVEIRTVAEHGALVRLAKI
ncbi:methyltransferase [Nocardioides mesophilus]|uniref:Methyltransferase n=1 Tax=Nocardioides mesophilus TaxID=433659 RepID=A0A7G9R8I2_9ACTN|nr:methyltransferase [Nocardioides mesophilus]QNN51907.1 methyltransferase [Nocardioides mesophilus]